MTFPLPSKPLPAESVKTDSRSGLPSRLPLFEEIGNRGLRKDSQEVLSFQDFMKSVKVECNNPRRSMAQEHQERLRLHREYRAHRFKPYEIPGKIIHRDSFSTHRRLTRTARK